MSKEAKKAKPDARAPRVLVGWGVYNWGSLAEFFSLRRDAFKYVREESRHYLKPGQSWRRMYEIHKIEARARERGQQ